MFGRVEYGKGGRNIKRGACMANILVVSSGERFHLTPGQKHYEFIFIYGQLRFRTLAELCCTMSQWQITNMVTHSPRFKQFIFKDMQCELC